MKIAVRTNAWYGDEVTELAFPTDWNLAVAECRGAPSLPDLELGEAIRRPIDSRGLRELAAGKNNVVILVEDITRPTPCATVFTLLLSELNQAGVEDGAVTVIVANGTHRPMTRHETMLKLGEGTYRRVRVLPHNCYDNLAHVGRTRAGTEVDINAVAASADLLVGVGGVYPHGMAGYSGGAKIVLPGIGSIRSIEQNHLIRGSGHGVVEGNPIREDMEEAARMVGLSFVVNAVINPERQICGLFAGDPVQGHRAACRFAGAVYRTVVPFEPEVVVLNAYPMDTELFQAGKALGAARRVPGVRVVVLLARCPDGFGYHGLCGPQGRFNLREKDGVRRGLEGRRLIISCENVELRDVRNKYPDEALLCRSWDQAVETVRREIGERKPNVLLFPSATIQLPEMMEQNAPIPR